MRSWNLLQHLSIKDNERNLCQDLLTIENTDLDLKVHARAALCKWANCTRQTFLSVKNFCKLTKQAETIRNHQNRFLLWRAIVWEIHKLTRYQSREFSCKNIRVSLQLAWADLIIHSQREIEVFFSTLKNPPFPLAQSIKLHISALVRIPCVIPCHRREKYAR